MDPSVGERLGFGITLVLTVYFIQVTLTLTLTLTLTRTLRLTHQVLLRAAIEMCAAPELQLLAASATVSRPYRAKLARVLRRDPLGRWCESLALS